MVVRLSDLNNGKSEKKKGLVRLSDISEQTPLKLGDNELRNEKVSMMREPSRAPALSVPQVEYRPSNSEEKRRRAEQRDAQDPKNPVLKAIKDNTVDALAGAADSFFLDTKPGQFVSRMGQSGLQLMGGKPTYEATTGSKAGDVTADITGMIGGAFVNPSNLQQSFVSTGLNNPLTQKAAAYVGSKIANPLGSKVATEATRGAMAGAFEGGAMSFTRGDNPSQVVQETALGAGVGGALGGLAPVVGKGLEKIVSKLKTKPQSSGPLLSLPEPKVRGNVNGVQTDATIATPYTFKLPDASPQTLQKGASVREAWDEVATVSDEIRQLESRYQKAIIDQYKFLKESRDARGGVQQGNLIRSQDGDVVGRYGRISNNPQWYRDYYAQNGRVPSNKELYRLAQKHIDEGFSDDGVNIPSWKLENQYDETLQALSQVRDELRGSLKDSALNLTDAKLKGEALGFERPKLSTESQTPKPLEVAAERLRQQEPLKRPQIAEAAPPRKTPQQMQERGFVDTLRQSDKPPEGFVERLKAMYKPITNEDSVAKANARINNGNIEDAVHFVMNSKPVTAERITTGHRLIDEFNKRGEHQRAVDVAERLAELGTKMGQSIQAFSIYNRLTPEGILIHANRVAQKVNDSLPRGVKEVKVTSDMAAQLTDLAGTVQHMSGVKGSADDIMSMLEKAKRGEQLTDIETQQIKRFVNEAKQFVKEANNAKPPRAPKAPKEFADKRVKDKVISLLDAQEQAAKERLRAKGIQISSMPLDIYADYAIIGAAKLSKGIVNAGYGFKEWTEEMVKDFGEQVRPILTDVWNKAQETLDLSTKRITKETIGEAERIAEKVIKTKGIPVEHADDIRKLAQSVSKLSGDAKRYAQQDLQAVLNQLDKPGVLQKISSFQTMMQLLNPKTLLTRNPLGNEMFYRLERMTKFAATPVDWGRVQLFGGQRSVTFRTHNQGQYWKNFIEGAVAGWKGVNPDGITTQYDIRGQAFSHKWNPLTYMEKTLGASLKGFDYAAYKRAVNHTIGEMATLRALNEGHGGNKELIKKYIREADENILRIADEYGKYVTFQDNNMLSVGLQKFKKGLNLGKEWGVGDLVIKYPKTPGALLMRALEYSPIGILRAAKIAANPYYFKKDPNTHEAIMAITRASIGTFGLSGLGYFLIDKGILTGSASKDRDVRDLQRQAGQGQYQVNLSAFKRFVESGFNPDAAKIKENDMLYTYDWAQPVAIAVSMGANMKKSINEAKKIGQELPLMESIYQAGAGGLNTLVEQSVLSGIRDAAQGYPGQTVMDKVVDIMSDIPGSFTPTFANQINQAMDNTRRETYSPDKLEQSLNKAQAKIPVLSRALPQKHDTFGKPQPALQKNSLFNVFLNPGFATRYKLTPEAKFTVDLINQTGDETIAPRVPSKSLNVKLPGGKSESVKLTGEQFARLQQLAGEETQKRFNRINPNLSESARIRKAAEALREAGERARKQLKKEMGVR